MIGCLRPPTNQTRTAALVPYGAGMDNFRSFHRKFHSGRVIRGKSLGGSSALNFLTWNRPQREDIEGWSKLCGRHGRSPDMLSQHPAIGKLGNKGWTWDLFYKYAKRIEK